MQAPQFNEAELWPPNQAPLREPENAATEPVKDRYISVEMNEHGELVDLEHALSRHLRKKIKVRLRLAPGLCLLRKLQVQGLSKKEIDAALELWAEESLPQTPEQYYLDSWRISANWRGLVALPAQPLSRAREQLSERGARIVQLQVAELSPPQDRRSGIVLWPTTSGLLACLWENGVLYDWQSFPQGIVLEFALTQLSVCCNNPPAWIYVEADATYTDALSSTLISLWPEATIEAMREWSPALRQRRFGAGLVFDSYLNEHHYQPATSKDKFRLILAIAACVIAGLFLIYAEIQQLEQQVETLRHHDSLLKVQASRSEQVAKRSGNTLRQIRELRAMTMERPGVMNALKALTETLPPKIRLESINLERRGVVAVDGLAETEVDISSFLERLGQTPIFQNPNLTFTQKDATPAQSTAETESEDQAQTLIRFRLETRLTQPLLIVPAAEPGSDADAS